ncbi:uncharacterized protein LJ206_013390 isoform 1-T4 [Theristicus caerulescens]
MLSACRPGQGRSPAARREPACPSRARAGGAGRPAGPDLLAAGAASVTRAAPPAPHGPRLTALRVRAGRPGRRRGGLARRNRRQRGAEPPLSGCSLTGVAVPRLPLTRRAPGHGGTRAPALGEARCRHAWLAGARQPAAAAALAFLPALRRFSSGKQHGTESCHLPTKLQNKLQ